MKRRGYLLDFAGTLRDDLKPVYLGTRDVFARFGRKPPSFAEYRRTISSDYWLFYRKSGFGDEERPEVDRLFNEIFFERYASRAVLFPDVLSTITELKRRGRSVGIVSNLRRSLLQQHIMEDGLENMVDAIVSREDTDRHKPYPEPILAGFSKLGLSPSDGSYTGDEISDIEASRSAGAFSIAISRKGSHHTRKMLESVKPDLVIGSLTGLLDFDSG
ncbi:MAG: HAD hydrolase-like protein [Candidatus Aenigmarchaeota archaeon]|nr:HAD hydrolase-like protein [Candidatus Aenigmarchaeota archaeon]